VQLGVNGDLLAREHRAIDQRVDDVGKAMSSAG